MASVRIGISGWTYPGWRGSFYPTGLQHRRELEHAAAQFGAIEINGTFYSLQRATSFVSWRDQTPDDFVFSVKGGRFITHLKRLTDVEVPLANFFASGVLALGAKLGPVLWQLPPTLAYDRSLLDEFLAQLPRTSVQAAVMAAGHDERVPADRAVVRTDADRPLRHALEVRHDSFRSDEALALLESHGVAMVVADTAGKWPLIETSTTDFVYVRLHGDRALYVSGYSDQALDSWAAKILRWQRDGLDVFAFFDNDAKVHAPYDAAALAERCGVTRPTSSTCPDDRPVSR